MRMTTTFYTIAFCCAVAAVTQAQQQPKRFTRADTLRGSNGPARAWWDAEFYDLHVAINPADSSIRGWNSITYRVVAESRGPRAENRTMQIDLQLPLQIDS